MVLSIQRNQVRSNPPPEETTPPGDINPTLTKPGLRFSSINPRINVTLNQAATLALIYLPVDRPNQPSNVNEFVVVFFYVDGTNSQPFTSRIPSTSRTDEAATLPLGISSEASTTSSRNRAFPPSDASPRIDLPPNFRVPQGTKLMLIITSTRDRSKPTGVSVLFFGHCFVRTIRMIRYFHSDILRRLLRTADLRKKSEECQCKNLVTLWRCELLAIL